MALLMGGAMGVVMLGFMWGMHQNVKLNIGILAGAVVLMAVALWLSRSQQFVDEVRVVVGSLSAGRGFGPHPQPELVVGHDGQSHLPT